MAWCEGFVPPGELRLAESLMLDTLRQRLSTVAYEMSACPGNGSGDERFIASLASAVALHSPLIVCPLPGIASDPSMRANLIDSLRLAGDAAGRQGIVLALDLERRSTRQGFLARGSMARISIDGLSLLREIGHPFVRLRWGPAAKLDFDPLMEELEAFAGLVPQLAARAMGEGGEREPLEARDEDWQLWLDCFERQAGLGNMSHYVVLYGGAEDGGLGLRADAAYLRTTLGRLAKARA